MCHNHLLKMVGFCKPDECLNQMEYFERESTEPSYLDIINLGRDIYGDVGFYKVAEKWRDSETMYTQKDWHYDPVYMKDSEHWIEMSDATTIMDHYKINKTLRK